MTSKMFAIVVILMAGMLISACGKEPANGPISYPGAKGDKGDPGVDGQDGQDGAQGTPGVGGSSITTVKLCPSVPDTYGSSFPEYAICLGNKMYAVYWNGSTSFLAYLTPGNYRTTSTGANCNFRLVINSCVVVNY